MAVSIVDLHDDNGKSVHGATIEGECPMLIHWNDELYIIKNKQGRMASYRKVIPLKLGGKDG